MVYCTAGARLIDDDLNCATIVYIRKFKIVMVVVLYQACFRRNVTVVTIYASLGEEALCHSLNEVSLSCLAIEICIIAKSVLWHIVCVYFIK